MPNLPAGVAAGLGLQLFQAHPWSPVAALLEATPNTSILQSTAVIQVGAVDAKGPRSRSVLAILLALAVAKAFSSESFSRLALVLSFAFALEAVARLVEDPRQVVIDELDRFGLLQTLGRVVVQHHVDLATLGVVLEHVVKEVEADAVVATLAEVAVAKVARVLLVLPVVCPVRLGRGFVKGVSKDLADRHLHFAVVNAAVRQDSDPLLLVIREATLFQEQMAQQMVPGIGLQEVEALLLQLGERRLLRSQEAGYGLAIATLSPKDHGFKSLLQPRFL